jgi:photosystem II stability/assembly factor-like uncharacterized protein
MKKIYLLLPSLIFLGHLSAQWIQQNSGTTRVLNEIFFTSSDSGFVVGDGGTVLKTTNGGATWQSLNTGLTLDFNELYFLNSSRGWIVGDSGCIGFTSNGGQTWTFHFLDSASSINLNSVFALNSTTLFVGGQKNSSDGYIAKSVNGGTIWVRAGVEAYIWSVNIMKIGMVSATTGYAATRGNVLKTIDGGLNWFITDTASVHSGAMFHVLEDLSFFPGNDTVYVCGWYGAYLGKTTNAGTTWQHNNQFQNYNMDFINTRVGYVGGWSQIHKTTDGGITFTDASGGNPALFTDVYSIDFVGEWIGYACGAGGLIIKTTNGGATGFPELSDNMESILFYPNPVTDLISFSKKTNVKIMDLSGRVFISESGVNALNLSGLTAGVYIIEFMDDRGGPVQYYKIIKQ